MKAVVTNSNKPGCLELGEVAEPIADSNEAVIAVTAFSLNRGELRRAEAAEAGTQQAARSRGPRATHRNGLASPHYLGVRA